MDEHTTTPAAETATAPVIRPARADDVAAIVEMLADDAVAAGRESPDDPAPYQKAYQQLAEDPHQHLVVAEYEGRVVGTLQLTIIPGLSRRGASRGLIEAVRTHRDFRGRGLGSHLITWAIEESRRQDCRLVQLTSDASRTDAHRFYERLGFSPTHVGFKMSL